MFSNQENNNQFITPSKVGKLQEFYTPFTNNKQKLNFTANKNVSASKFYIDDQFISPQQVQIDSALERIDSTTLNAFSIVTQDVIKLIYIFPNIKMLCTYPIERLQQCKQQDLNSSRYQLFVIPIPLLLYQVQQNQKEFTTLTTSINYPLSVMDWLLQHIPNSTEEVIIKLILDSECVLETIKRFNIKQVFYLDNLQMCRYLLCTDSIPQHIVCSNSLLPFSNSQELKNFLQIRTDYLGPTLELGLGNSSQFIPNYKLNQVIFVEQEQHSRILGKLMEQQIKRAAFKFNNANSLSEFEDYCLEHEISLKDFQLVTNTTEIKFSDLEVLVHVDQIQSLQEYLNDCAFLNKDCVSIVQLSNDKYLKKRKSLYFQQTDNELLLQIYTYIQSQQSYCLLNDIAEKFQMDNIIFLVNILEKYNLIQIDQIQPTKCQVSIDNMADTNSEQVNELLRQIKLQSRRIISLRKEISTIKHYQINLVNVSKVTQKPIVDLCIQIENLKNIFIEPQFSDYSIQYQINDQKQEQIIHCAEEITKLRQRQIEELDIFHCLGNSLKSRSLSICSNFHSNQEKLAEIVEKYFNSETPLSIGQVFNHNHQKYLPIRNIEGIREKTQILQDIRRISQKDEQMRDILRKLMKQYQFIDPKQLSELIRFQKANTGNKHQRIQGWMMGVKKIKL